MTAKRRPAEESRALLIAAAVEIIRHEGYAALTARRLAEKAGLKRQIVHYYFRTIEELLIAVVRHYGESGLVRFADAARSENPLRIIWENDDDESATAFAFIAMATHLPAIREEVRRYMELFRRLETKAVEQFFKADGIKSDISPAAAVVIIQSISRQIASEAKFDVTTGHAETKAVIDGWLESLSRTGNAES